MPIEYHIDTSRRRLTARIVGDVSFAEILETIDAAMQDPDFEPGFDILDDHTEITRAISVEDAKSLAEWLGRRAERFAECRWAIVTSRIDSYGTMRMLSALTEPFPIHIHVFKTRQEAEDWLGS